MIDMIHMIDIIHDPIELCFLYLYDLIDTYYILYCYINTIRLYQLNHFLYRYYYKRSFCALSGI